ATAEVARRRARLACDQLARGSVPRVQVALEVHVEATTGDHAQIDRGGPEPADVADLVDEPGDHGGLAPPGGRVVRESGADQRERQVGRSADPDRLAVAGGTGPRRSGEQLV